MEERIIYTEELKQCLKNRREELSDICINSIMEYLSGKPLTGPNDALNQIVSNILNLALQAERESHIEATKDKHNRRNGLMPKTIENQFGDLEIVTPRDSNGSFAS